jgi:NADPH-dependent glutamate synthase beta subunit-like oxidoreductase
MDIPSYVMALAQGKFKEALAVIRETNPFPSICGRVCHHPCEAACNRALIDRPVAIEWLKRFAGEYEILSNGRPEAATPVHDARVAIVGSGPAGLTAAHDLVKQGFRVSVFEAEAVAGGMLAAGIPEFVLPKRIVEAEIEYIRALGVKIKTGIRIGRDMGLDDLFAQGYQAVLVAAGAWKSAGLNVRGAELGGVQLALPFLKEAKLGQKRPLKGTVAVIGGGNVALDAARTALRLGASEVVLTCLESRDQMPAFAWEIEQAELEGVRVLNSVAPQEFLSRPVSRLGGIRFQAVKTFSRDESGRVSWTTKDGVENESLLAATAVIVAIGQAQDTSLAPELKRAASGSIEVDAETLATSRPGVYAAGDAVRLPGTVTEAIRAGHQAAAAMARALGAKIEKTEGTGYKSFVIEKETIPAFLARKDRWDMPALSAKDAVRSMSETLLGYTEEQVREEAKRCLNCRMCGNCLFGRGQICVETSARLL